MPINYNPLHTIIFPTIYALVTKCGGFEAKNLKVYFLSSLSLNSDYSNADIEIKVKFLLL